MKRYRNLKDSLWGRAKQVSYPGFLDRSMLEGVYKINLKQLSNDDYGLIDVTLNAS